MALTLAEVATPYEANFNEYHAGSKKFRTMDVTFDSSYPTGGESVTAESLGWSYIEGVVGTPLATNTGSSNTFAMPVYAKPNAAFTSLTLQLYQYDGSEAATARLEEVANASNQASYTARITFIGY